MQCTQMVPDVISLSKTTLKVCCFHKNLFQVIAKSVISVVFTSNENAIILAAKTVHKYHTLTFFIVHF